MRRIQSFKMRRGSSDGVLPIRPVFICTMNARVSRRRETKACNTCAKAKVKCETEFRKDRCKRCVQPLIAWVCGINIIMTIPERCHRLDKICENQMPGAHSNKKLLESRYSKEYVQPMLRDHWLHGVPNARHAQGLPSPRIKSRLRVASPCVDGSFKPHFQIGIAPA